MHCLGRSTRSSTNAIQITYEKFNQYFAQILSHAFIFLIVNKLGLNDEIGEYGELYIVSSFRFFSYTNPKHNQMGIFGEKTGTHIS